MSFSKLGLSEALVRAVTEHGYTTPTPVQAQAIPAVLAGGDLLAGAQTGTGKTAGFVLPTLQRLSTRPSPSRGRPVRALILTPTRELAAQVEESVRIYGKYVKLTSAVIFGGVGIHPQIAQLKRGVDILVATPGRLLDLAGQRAVDLSQVEILVLDEADRMLDMGFIRDIKRVLALLPRQRQNLLFSATFSDEIKALADSLLDNPAMIEVARRNSTVEVIRQKVHPVDRERKRELLAHLISTGRWEQVLVFTRTKHGANKLAEQLDRDGIPALAIHGNKSQGARTRALSEFKEGGLNVLVATDIAARGIDIEELPHVVNYDLPNVPEDYVHRIGRTGRAGATGEAVSLVCVDDRAFLRDIEKLIKRRIDEEVIPGFEPDPDAVAQPVLQRGAQRGQRHDAPRAARGGQRTGETGGSRGHHDARRGEATAARHDHEARRGPPHAAGESRRHPANVPAHARPGGAARDTTRGPSRPAHAPSGAPKQGRPHGAPKGQVGAPQSGHAASTDSSSAPAAGAKPRHPRPLPAPRTFAPPGVRRFGGRAR